MFDVGEMHDIHDQITSLGPLIKGFFPQAAWEGNVSSIFAGHLTTAIS